MSFLIHFSFTFPDRQIKEEKDSKNSDKLSEFYNGVGVPVDERDENFPTPNPNPHSHFTLRKCHIIQKKMLNLTEEERDELFWPKKKYPEFHKCEHFTSNCCWFCCSTTKTDNRQKIGWNEKKEKVVIFTYFSIFFLSCIYSIFSCHFHHRINAKEMMRSRRRIIDELMCGRHNEINFEKV